MDKANQKNLKERTAELMIKFENDQNERISRSTLTELILYYNENEADKDNLQWYFEVANRTGNSDDFTGASLVANWYKRNLYMYSLVQKLTESKDDKIMVLVGAGHAAMFRQFIEKDPTFELVELSTVLK
nr:DUF5694 domain-containing protein [Flavobacterium sp. 140616W15]